MDSSKQPLQVPHATFPAGKVIFREGAIADCLFFILKGKVEISINGPEGKIILNLVEKNMIFGEMAILDHGRRSATALALEDTTCQMFSADTIESELEKLPSFLKALFRIMTLNLRTMNRREQEIIKQNKKKPVTDKPEKDDSTRIG